MARQPKIRTCSCARHRDGSVTTSHCPLHAEQDPCATMASITGKRRKGSIIRGVCSACGWSEEGARQARAQERLDDYRRRIEAGEWETPRDNIDLPATFDPAKPILTILAQGSDAWAEVNATLHESAWEGFSTEWEHVIAVDLRDGTVRKVTGATFTWEVVDG